VSGLNLHNCACPCTPGAHRVCKTKRERVNEGPQIPVSSRVRANRLPGTEGGATVGGAWA
jgi:hypothetical protein